MKNSHSSPKKIHSLVKNLKNHFRLKIKRMKSVKRKSRIPSSRNKKRLKFISNMMKILNYIEINDKRLLRMGVKIMSKKSLNRERMIIVIIQRTE